MRGVISVKCKIAVCGKGGSGKSVISALLANVLAEKGYKVLIIDSDESNPGLYRLMGFENTARALVEEFRGGAEIMREVEMERITLANIPKEYYVERDGIKLMIAGKITAAFQGCACTLGSIVKHFIGKLALNKNECVLIDTEAGVEHFGRGLEKNVDIVLIVVEPYFESISVAEKIKGLASQITSCRVRAIMNKVTTESEEIIERKLHERGIKTIGKIYEDYRITEACLHGVKLGQSFAKDEINKIINALFQEISKEGVYNT